MDALLETWRLKYGIHPAAIRFLLRAVFLFILWNWSYHYWMVPKGIPDIFIVQRLGELTAGILNYFFDVKISASHSVTYVAEAYAFWMPKTTILRNGNQPLLIIASPCNGLNLMVIASGFILCYEAGFWRRLRYFLLAIFSVFAINVLRCCLLCSVSIYQPEYFDFLHKFFFNLCAYAMVFLIWIRYTKASRAADILNHPGTVIDKY